jgi:hypothetical protein
MRARPAASADRRPGTVAWPGSAQSGRICRSPSRYQRQKCECDHAKSTLTTGSGRVALAKLGFMKPEFRGGFRSMSTFKGLRDRAAESESRPAPLWRREERTWKSLRRSRRLTRRHSNEHQNERYDLGTTCSAASPIDEKRREPTKDCCRSSSRFGVQPDEREG